MYAVYHLLEASHLGLIKHPQGSVPSCSRELQNRAQSLGKVLYLSRNQSGQCHSVRPSSTRQGIVALSGTWRVTASRRCLVCYGQPAQGAIPPVPGESRLALWRTRSPCWSLPDNFSQGWGASLVFRVSFQA